MNIFVLDETSKLCAQYHHDVHVRKMIVETAQLLSTAHHEFPNPHVDLEKIYKPTHKNHPCALWVRESQWNYRWAWWLFYELCNEYRFRSGKIHKTTELYHYLQYVPSIEKEQKTQWPLCMPDEFKISNNAVASYRNFYSKKKMLDKNGKPMAFWTRREIPEWIVI